MEVISFHHPGNTKLHPGLSRLFRKTLMSEKSLKIQPIQPEDLASSKSVDAITEGEQELYWTLNWTPEFYIQLAKQGFISTAVYLDQPGSPIPILLPEMQKAYSVLHWGNLHMSRSMQRWMKTDSFKEQSYRLSAPHNLQDVISGVRQCHGENCWIIEPYEDLLQQLLPYPSSDFQLLPVALLNKENHLVAGEIGYKVGNIYTSLTGFFDRSDPVHNHAGKLQMHLLAQQLEKQNISFWNLGHPGMQYKLDLGAKVFPRKEFLTIWRQENV